MNIRLHKLSLPANSHEFGLPKGKVTRHIAPFLQRGHLKTCAMPAIMLWYAVSNWPTKAQKVLH